MSQELYYIDFNFSKSLFYIGDRLETHKGIQGIYIIYIEGGKGNRGIFIFLKLLPCKVKFFCIKTNPNPVIF